MQGIPYFNVSLHYINDKWEPVMQILSTRAMKEKHTSENIYIRLKEIL